jgi:ligand-binding SRPBCC domain-containing protein
MRNGLTPGARRASVPVIRIETLIKAPVERCFDLARDPDVHARSVAQTGERVVSRTGRGLPTLGDEITFEAVHLGIRQHLTARITRFEPPRLFEDRMVRGAFRSFIHLHAFQRTDAGTLMTDRFEYRSPFGPLGSLADWLFLTRYLRRLLTGRAAYLKRLAERD